MGKLSTETRFALSNLPNYRFNYYTASLVEYDEPVMLVSYEMHKKLLKMFK